MQDRPCLDSKPGFTLQREEILSSEAEVRQIPGCYSCLRIYDRVDQME